MTYRTYALKDLIEVKHGFAFPGDKFSDNLNFPTLVTPGNFRIGGGFIDAKPKTFLGEPLEEYILEPGDLIVTMTDLSKAGDSLGYSAEVPRGKTYLHNQRVGKILNKKPDLLSSKYLNWFMRTKQYRNSIMGSATGTTVRHTSPSRILEIEISLPSLQVQTVVANILDSLDSQIALNELLSKTLEDIAQAIFKSWFIEFDPVKAKMAGEQPAGLDTATTALIPDSMEESDLGLIPSGWEVRSIGSLCETLLGGTPSRSVPEYWSGDIPWINSGKVNDFRIVTATEFISQIGLEKSATKLLPKGTTVLAITGATLGQYSRLEIDSCANQSVVGILGSDKASNEFIFMSIKNGIQRLITAQTGGAQQHINKEDVKSFSIIYPGRELMNAYTDAVVDIFTEIAVLLAQSTHLANIRDSLLPRLLSGELHIPEEMLAS